MRDLNKYFKYLGSTRIKNEQNLLREYPRYDETVRRYKAEYEKSMSKQVEIPKISKGQVYTIPYSLIGGESFELNISVDKLYNLINDNNKGKIIKNSKEYNKEFILRMKVLNDNDSDDNSCENDIMRLQLNSDMLKMILNVKDIDKRYANECVNNNEDVICGDFYGITSERVPFVILDGNHRCYGKIKAGHKLINGVLVSRNVWINCLLTETDKMFIKIFWNMNVILGYRAGKSNMDYVKKNLYSV